MKILIVVTDIQSDKNAIMFGGLLAEATNSELTLLYVASSEREEKRGEQILSQAEDLIPGLDVDKSLCTGKLVSRTLTEVRENQFDLVVVEEAQRLVIAQQSRRPLIRAIINRTSASVVVIRRFRKELKRILICTGGIKVAEPMIEAGAYVASAAKAHVTLLHVAGTIPSMYTGLDEIDETLAELLKTETPTAKHLRQAAGILESYGLTAQLELRHGVVANEILREATKDQSDLIVIGAPEKKKILKQWLFGDVTRAVLEGAPCPVLIVNGPLGDEPK